MRILAPNCHLLEPSPSASLCCTNTIAVPTATKLRPNQFKLVHALSEEKFFFTFNYWRHHRRVLEQGDTIVECWTRDSQSIVVTVSDCIVVFPASASKQRQVLSTAQRSESSNNACFAACAPQQKMNSNSTNAQAQQKMPSPGDSCSEDDIDMELISNHSSSPLVMTDADRFVTVHECNLAPRIYRV